MVFIMAARDGGEGGGVQGVATPPPPQKAQHANVHSNEYGGSSGQF